MRLRRERAKRHARGREAAANFFDRFHFIDGHGDPACELDLQQILDRLRLMFVGGRANAGVIFVRARAQELVHRSDELWIPSVELAFALFVDAIVTFVVQRRCGPADADIIRIS